jgi:pimeloyl-ACP methyl ester carboxylesterase
MDFRGRGRSQYDANSANYRIDVELGDVIALLDHLKIGRAAALGTSRGGLVGLLMANAHPQRIAGLLLNDVGAVLEKKGLLRIRSYLGKPIAFRSFATAAKELKRLNPGFLGLTRAQWLAFARRIYRDEGGVPQLDYDPALAATFPTNAQIRTGLVPPAWPLLPALNHLPVALLRGEKSDLLSRRTAIAMRKIVPRLDITTIPDRGHAPFLDEPASQAAIARWFRLVDET